MTKSIKKTVVILSAIFSSLFAVLLFYRAGFGINFFLFNVIFSIVILTCAYVSKRVNTSMLLNLILLTVLSFTYLINTSTPIRVGFFLLWVYFILNSLYTMIRPNDRFEFWQYLTAPIEEVVMGLVMPLSALTKVKIVKSNFWNTLIRVGIGVIIAIPIIIAKSIMNMLRSNSLAIFFYPTFFF